MRWVELQTETLASYLASKNMRLPLIVEVHCWKMCVCGLEGGRLFVVGGKCQVLCVASGHP